MQADIQGQQQCGRRDKHHPRVTGEGWAAKRTRKTRRKKTTTTQTREQPRTRANRTKTEPNRTAPKRTETKKPTQKTPTHTDIARPLSPRGSCPEVAYHAPSPLPSRRRAEQPRKPLLRWERPGRGGRREGEPFRRKVGAPCQRRTGYTVVGSIKLAKQHKSTHYIHTTPHRTLQHLVGIRARTLERIYFMLLN